MFQEEGDHYVNGMTRMASRLGETNIRRYGKGIRYENKLTLISTNNCYYINKEINVMKLIIGK